MSVPDPLAWQDRDAVLRTYQRLTAVLALAAALLVAGLVAQSFRPAHVPYVVAVDPFGSRQIEPLEPLTATHPRLVKAEIARFLHALRGRVADPLYQEELFRTAAAYLGDALRRELEVTMRHDAEGEAVAQRTVRLLSVLNRPDGTYLVRWEEVAHGVGSPKVDAWEAVVALAQRPALEESDVPLNPLGLHVTAFDAVRLAPAEP